MMTLEIILRNVDPQLHREFKAACSHFGLSMKRVLIKHMQNIVNDYWKDKKQLGESKTYNLIRRKK